MKVMSLAEMSKSSDIDIQKMALLISKLEPAAHAYYNTNNTLMENKEYDELYAELARLEEKTDTICKTWSTNVVGAKPVDELGKINHEYPALSLDKTKDMDEYESKFRKYINESGNKNPYVCLMWKMDGSTVQATYMNGKLITLATRGNGEVGSDITHNAPYIKGLPTKIPYKKKLIVRGEAVMSYKEFERINASLDATEQYKNPRNLANATISMLDPAEMRKREIWLAAFQLVYKEDGKAERFYDDLEFLKDNGFEVVQHSAVHIDNLQNAMKTWFRCVEDFDYPVDGLVCAMDNQEYTKNLKGTGHHPHIMNGFAFKWADETAETTIREIFWSPSRTGLFNPVAVFDPVELCGTTVERASLHNLSYIYEKDIKVGDRVTVYKANMIIPQIDENLNAGYMAEGEDDRTRYSIPKTCPICSKPLTISKDDNTGTTVLRCYNDDCGAKKIGSLVHFCERDCMDIRGMSEETITKLVGAGCISEYADFYKLEDHGEIANFTGFGQKSWENMMEAAKKSAQDVGFVPFIHALGIPNIGKGQAKLLFKHYKEKIPVQYQNNEEDYFEAMVNDLEKSFDFTEIDGIGPVMDTSLKEYFKNEKNNAAVAHLMPFLTFKKIPVMISPSGSETENSISGKTFVITGKLETYPNREALVAEIESKGGKVAGSVSKNTDYLINNDVTSTSGKNKKAKELGIPIISEADYKNL